MKEPIVADTTCLIGLERINHLDILPGLFEPIFIPPEVDREFGVALPWLTVHTPSNVALIATLKLLVDDGESEAIALANEVGWRILLDDSRARSVSRNLNVPVIGTVGVLVKAKEMGIVQLLRPILVDLEAGGFYIGTALMEEALRLAGE
ncbi:MAG: DUF3368 domain-containing protein [Blastocatellia bacterium]